ncbi:hypothetical protein Tco_0665818, partial [Tanacetum coccineum]
NCTQPKRPHNSDYFKDKMLLMQAQENGIVLDEEELLFLAGEQGNSFDADVDNQPVQDLALNEDNIFQADECDITTQEFSSTYFTMITIVRGNFSLYYITCIVNISLSKFKKRSPEELKPQSEDTRRTSGNTTRNDPFPPFLIIEAQTQVIEQYTARSGMDSKMAKTCYHSHLIPQISFRCYIVKMGVLQIGISAMVIENKVVNRTMSSPNHFTSDIEDAFSSMNILNYTSVSSDYFPTSSESRSFNSLRNFTDNIILSVFSPFYNNLCLKDVHAFYTQKFPISSPDPITPPAILTPSPVIPPSLLFNPQYFFIPEELLPPKKRIHSPSSSSTMLFNSSRNQTCNLVSPSSLVYTSIPPQVFKIGKCSDKMYLKHHEKEVEDILNYLDELYFHRIERMEEGHINGNELKTELKDIRIQIVKLQKKRLGQKDKIAFAHYRISNLEQIIEKIQARHQTNQEDL